MLETNRTFSSLVSKNTISLTYLKLSPKTSLLSNTLNKSLLIFILYLWLINNARHFKLLMKIIGKLITAALKIHNRLKIFFKRISN